MNTQDNADQQHLMQELTRLGGELANSRRRLSMGESVDLSQFPSKLQVIFDEINQLPLSRQQEFATLLAGLLDECNMLFNQTKDQLSEISGQLRQQQSASLVKQAYTNLDREKP